MAQPVRHACPTLPKCFFFFMEEMQWAGRAYASQAQAGMPSSCARPAAGTDAVPCTLRVPGREGNKRSHVPRESSGQWWGQGENGSVCSSETRYSAVQQEQNHESQEPMLVCPARTMPGRRRRAGAGARRRRHAASNARRQAARQAASRRMPPVGPAPGSAVAALAPAVAARPARIGAEMPPPVRRAPARTHTTCNAARLGASAPFSEIAV